MVYTVPLGRLSEHLSKLAEVPMGRMQALTVDLAVE